MSCEEYDLADDIAGESAYLDVPGTYHFLITRFVKGQGPQGTPIDGFTATLCVLDGTSKDQKDKNLNLCLFDPDPTKSDKAQKWAKMKQTAFLIATEAADLASLGKRVPIDWSAITGRQIIVTLEENEYNGKTNLQVAYANIYHIDDPRAAKFPKDAEAIALATKEMQRQPPEYFAPLLKKTEPKAGQSRLSQNDLADL
jgi:hypothetical protein